MKKTAGIIIALILALTALVACAKTTPPAPPAPPPADTSTPTPPAADTSTPTPAATPPADTSTPEPPAPPAAPVVLKVGATVVPHSEILAAAKPILAAQGIDLQVTEFTDYVQPVIAVEDGTLDANYFAHRPYLSDFNAESGTHVIAIADIHYEPFGIYPGKTKTLADLKDGAKVAVPNDTTNEARALLLLQEQGLIKLKDGADLTVTKKDIVENPKKLDIVELEAAQIPRTLPDVDIAVINGNYALEAGLSASTDALAVEAAGGIAATTFANVIAVKEGNENSPAVLELIKVLQSDEIKQFINGKYEDAVIPSK
jgi:D-methionine transport system substrate-binding protein